MGSFRTLKQESEGLYKEKGSKFIALAQPVSSEEGVEELLERVRKKYYDARHHCYAYILGPDKQLFKANDDGEPSHSAGDPILGQIRSFDLTNTLVVVVRYFGGTKLGVGGLIHAYKTAAKDALERNKIISVTITKDLVIDYPYDSTNEVMKLIHDFQVEILDQKFDRKCELRGLLAEDQKSGFIKKASTLIEMGIPFQFKIS